MGSFRRNNSGKVLVDKHTRKQFCMRVVYKLKAGYFFSLCMNHDENCSWQLAMW